jgi:hypothetical protein
MRGGEPGLLSYPGYSAARLRGKFTMNVELVDLDDELFSPLTDEEKAMITGAATPTGPQQ